MDNSAIGSDDDFAASNTDNLQIGIDRQQSSYRRTRKEDCPSLLWWNIRPQILDTDFKFVVAFCAFL